MTRSHSIRFVIQAFVIVTLALGSAGLGFADQGKLYYTTCFEGCALRKANLDGSDRQLALFEDIQSDFDLTYRKVYYAGGYFSNPDTFRRANMNGSDAETLLSEFGYVNGVTVDSVDRKFYFSTLRFDGNTTSGEIVKVNLDGSNPEVILSVIANGVDVDPFGEKLYLVTEAGIQRCDLDGTNLETVVGDGDVAGLSPAGIALDPARGKLYWANGPYSDSRIMRANLDGAAVETLVSQADIQGTFSPLRIALDLGARKIYWTDDHAIRKANTDGSNIQVDAPGNAVPATSIRSAVLLALLLIGLATAVLLRQRSRGPSVSHQAPRSDDRRQRASASR